MTISDSTGVRFYEAGALMIAVPATFNLLFCLGIAVWKQFWIRIPGLVIRAELKSTYLPTGRKKMTVSYGYRTDHAQHTGKALIVVDAPYYAEGEITGKLVETYKPGNEVDVYCAKNSPRLSSLDRKVEGMKTAALTAFASVLAVVVLDLMADAVNNVPPSSEHFTRLRDIGINLGCCIVGFHTGTYIMRTFLGKSTQLSFGVGLFVGFGLIYFVGEVFHVSFYLNFLSGPEPWDQLDRFLVFSLLSLVYAVYRHFRERLTGGGPHGADR